jgi:hypothetical protein
MEAMSETKNDPLCLVFIPALVTVLLNKERAKGSPLTEDEVLAIRDECVAIAVPFSAALEMQRDIGYPDIIAEDCWNEWQRVRTQLLQDA